MTLGDRVEYISNSPWFGTVRAVFHTGKGEPRVVVEEDGIFAVMHLTRPDQLRAIDADVREQTSEDQVQGGV